MTQNYQDGCYLFTNWYSLYSRKITIIWQLITILVLTQSRQYNKLFCVNFDFDKSTVLTTTTMDLLNCFDYKNYGFTQLF